MEKDVGAGEFREGAAVLLEKLQRYRPGVIWLQGRKPYESLCRAAGVDLQGGWGLQPDRLDGMPLFVTPNPSPANAAFSLDALVGYYNQLAAYAGAGSSRHP